EQTPGRPPTAPPGPLKPFTVAGMPVLGRPVIDVSTGAELVQPLFIPGQLLGTWQMRNELTAGGLEVNAVRVLAGADSWRLTGLVGARYAHVRDWLLLRQGAVVQDPTLQPLVSLTDEVFA